MSRNGTRTKCTNGRPALLLSTVAAEDFNVRPTETKSIVCPDCGTWRRIIGDTRLKIREHPGFGKVTGGEKPASCPGSYQLVVIDIDVRAWQARQDWLLRDAMPAENRRAGRQFYKPLSDPAVPIHRIKARVTLDKARQIYLAHRTACAACTGRSHCDSGLQLADLYVQRLQEEPQRQEHRAGVARYERQAERSRTRSFPRRRAAEWDRVRWSVAATDAQRGQVPDGTAPAEGPDVPLEPLRVRR
ncbi:hypothetical protein J7E88_33075 [Streptomyces sp. ISL-10]|uniref:hypothetical protein n=1 Tax=Streptomyces sp. ISL-10 TaxID=2819172 RepID=UPI001BE8C902|nr:hypothetical protein [Streptomyces sp. ISL-10]MBT2369972.1 hypothetical protein [Streptomyces sp. ISL-10]